LLFAFITAPNFLLRVLVLIRDDLLVSIAVCAMVAGPLRPEEEKLFEGQPKGFPLDGFEIEDVMLPEGDDLGIPSEDDEEAEDELEFDSGFGSVIGEFSVCTPPDGAKVAHLSAHGCPQPLVLTELNALPGAHAACSRGQPATGAT
jgi:hypothetical protein